MHPQTNFPGRAQEGLLGQLLRKKHEPAVADWIASGLSAGPSFSSSTTPPNNAPQTTEHDEETDELWAFASNWMGERAARYAVEENAQDYTEVEREQGIENVRTGLREMDEEGESDEESQDGEGEAMDLTGDMGVVTAKAGGRGEKGEGQRPMGRIEEVVRFMETGIM